MTGIADSAGSESAAMAPSRGDAVAWLARLAPAMLVVAMLIPILAIDLPPFTDLLGHIGRYAIQTGLDDHPWLAQYYSFRWQVIGNLGADILIEALSPFFDVERSAWIIVLFNQLLATAGILLLCREIHGRITPFCLFALPLIYSGAFTYGFINFTLSMALALLAFTLWLRLGHLGFHAVRAWLFVPIGLGLWLCHTFGWAFLGMLCAAQSLVEARGAGRTWPAALRDTILRCLPLALPLLPMLAWRGQPGATGGTDGWSIPLKLHWLMATLRLDHEVIDRISSTMLLGLIYFGLRSPRLSRDRTMLAAAAVSFLAFLILPMRVFGSHYADMRLMPYVVIVALLAIGDEKLDRNWRRWLMAAGTIFLIARLALSTATYVERERILVAHLEALDAIPDRARVVTLISGPCSATWEFPWLTHVGSLAIARKHAFANNQWVSGAINPLSVHYPEAGNFASDPSEFVHPARCVGDNPKLGNALAAVPAKAFTHVWILGVSPHERLPRDDLTPVWRGPDSAVYRIGAGQ